MLDKISYKHQINTLENENETLKNIIKEELYQEFMDYVDTRAENERLKETNKKLRGKLKELQNRLYKGGKK